MKTIKKIALSLIIFIIFVFASYVIATSNIFIKYMYSDNDIYNKTYNSIVNKIDDYVVDDKISEVIFKSITSDRIKNDINYMIDNKLEHNEVFLDYENELTGILKEHYKKEEILKNNVSNINKIINENVFFEKEFNKLNKINISLLYKIIIGSILIGILIISLFFYKKRDITLSFMSVGLFLIVIKVISYFSAFYDNFKIDNLILKDLIGNYTHEVFNLIMIIGLGSIILSIVLSDMKPVELEENE